MAEVIAAEVPVMERDELFCAYGAMILKDSGKDMSEENLKALIKAAGGSVEPFFTALFSKMVQDKDLEPFLKFGGGGGGGGGAAPAAAGGGNAAPAAGKAAKEEKVVEEEEEEAMDFDLFG
eukprot:CAMPEP_0170590742 /NCGR_PEP_ID=MMETSP0224-20130122/12030_1 /TAXON_ID=285029 /ORGANISM="Togula jolla, Strain CCCM 725" /LENGTH=120 /DNA_ID=CAMNT_0010914555 /DNA_START=65 /DNA_END=427 /DNA_ORIENTATION=+